MKIFLQNLSEKTTKEDISQAAEEFGKVQSVMIIKDVKDSKPNGTAYLEMSSREESLEAIKGLDGIELGGNKIKAAEAVLEGSSSHSHSKGHVGNSLSKGSFGRNMGGGKPSHLKGGGGANRGR